MLTQEELKEIIEYIPESGLMVWAVDRGPEGRIKAGTIVGTISKSDGYIYTIIRKKRYALHRLIWLYLYGAFPKGDIDHINHIRTDNTLDNLREVSRQDNMKNRSIGSHNKSGVIGVYWAKRESRWCASIKIDGKLKHLGYFVEFSDAVNARKNAEVLYGFHKNHGKDNK